MSNYNNDLVIEQLAEIESLRQQLAYMIADRDRLLDIMCEIAGSKSLTATPTQFYQHLQRIASDATITNQVALAVTDGLKDVILRQQLAISEGRLHDVAELCATVEQDRDTAWAQAHRLALELECLIMDTKDNAIVSKWLDSAFEAMNEYHKLKPGAAEDAEAWAKMRKAGI